MKETILSNNEFAIVLNNGVSIITNIDAIPNVIKMLETLGEKKALELIEARNKIVNAPKPAMPTTEQISSATKKTVSTKDYMPKTNWFPYTSLKAFAAGRGKLVISSEGKVFLSLAAAEEYYEVGRNYFSGILAGKFNKTLVNGIRDNMCCSVTSILRHGIDGEYDIEPNRNPLSKIYENVKTFCLGEKQGLPKKVAFMVFDNKMKFHYSKNSGHTGYLSAAHKIFTYCVPGRGWADVYGYDKNFDCNTIEHKFGNISQPKEDIFAEITNYLKYLYRL